MKTGMELHPSDLDRNPELALLTALHHTLDATRAMFTSTHPEIYFDDDRPYWLPPRPASPGQARALVDAIGSLDNAIGTSTWSRENACRIPRRIDRSRRR